MMMKKCLNKLYYLLDEKNVDFYMYKIHSFSAKKINEGLDTEDPYMIHNNNVMYYKIINKYFYMYFKKLILKKKVSKVIKENLSSKNSNILFLKSNTQNHTKNYVITPNIIKSIFTIYINNTTKTNVIFEFPKHEYKYNRLETYKNKFKNDIIDKLIENNNINSDVLSIIEKYLSHYYFEWLINETGKNWFYISSLNNLPELFITEYFNKCKHFYLLKYQKLNQTYIYHFLNKIIKIKCDDFEKKLCYLLFKYQKISEKQLEYLINQYSFHNKNSYNLMISICDYVDMEKITQENFIFLKMLIHAFKKNINNLKKKKSYDHLKNI